MSEVGAPLSQSPVARSAASSTPATLHPDQRQGLVASVLSRPLLVLLPCAILAAVLGLWSIRTLAREQVEDHLVAAMNSSSLALRNWCEERRKDAYIQSQATGIRELCLRLRAHNEADTLTEELLAETRELTSRLNEFCRAYGYTSFFVCDSAGAILASPNASATGQYFPPTDPVAWSAVNKGVSTLLPPRLCPIPLIAMDGKPLINRPILLVAAPVMGPADPAPIAVLCFTMSPDQGLSQVLETGRSGESGETYAFNASGVMVSNSRFISDLQQIGLIPRQAETTTALGLRLADPGVDLTGSHAALAIPMRLRKLTRMASSATKGDAGIDIDGYNDYRGVPVVGTWKWFHDYGFGITYEVDVAEAYRTAHRSYVVFGTMLIPIVLGTVIGEWNAIRKRRADQKQAFLLKELAAQSLQLEKRNVQLRDAFRAANTANEAKSQFLANMSHEIRTPLNSVLGFVDVLRVEGESLPSTTRTDYLDIVHRSGKHLLGLINDILDLSKIEAGKMTVECRAMRVPDVVEDVVSIMGARAREKRLTLKLNYETELPAHILSDAQRVKQVLINLVGNALKFTDEGGVTLTVLAPSPRNPEWIEFRVEDTGCGMSPEELGRIFEPFSQADVGVSRKFGGTGLGLTISKRFCEALGGTVTVKSEPELGSCFTASIRMGDLSGVAWSVPQRSHTSEVNRVAITRSEVLAGRRILIVDDGDTNRQILSLFLKRTGCEVFESRDGVAALRDVRRVRPDAVLMDMQMPRLDGYATTRRMRADGYFGAVIACSADAMAENIDRMKASGCDAVVPKPVEYPILIEQLEAAILSRGLDRFAPVTAGTL